MLDLIDTFTEEQKSAIAYFDENLDKWLVEDPSKKGKYAIIRGQNIVKLFDNFDEAFLEAVQTYAEGSYIIQQLTSPKDSINFYLPVLA